MDNNKEDIKRERFVRIIEIRVNRILDDLEKLGNCSNKKNYKYSEDDVKTIFSAIDKKTKEIKNKFLLTKANKNKFQLPK